MTDEFDKLVIKEREIDDFVRGRMSKRYNQGKEYERKRIVGIIKGKFRKAFPDLARQLVEEISGEK